MKRILPTASPKAPKLPTKGNPSSHGGGLVCFAGQAVALEVVDELPDAIRIAPWGVSQTEVGNVVINHATVAGLAVHNLHPHDKVVLDFAHNTESKDVPHPKPVAAYGVPEVREGEGLFLTNLEWTPDGQKAWKGRWYKDVSPTVARNAKGEVVFVKSAALCFNGRIPGAENFSTDNNDNDPIFMLKKSHTIAILNKSGANLSEDATDEQITAAADALAQGNEPSQDPGAPAMTDSMSAAVLKRLDNLAAEVKTLKETGAASSAAAAKATKEAIIAQATQDGKVIPLSNEDILADSFAVSTLQKMVERLPAGQVKRVNAVDGLKNEPAKNGGGSGSATVVLSAEDLEIARSLGVSKADLERFAALPDTLMSEDVADLLAAK